MPAKAEPHANDHFEFHKSMQSGFVESRDMVISAGSRLRLVMSQHVIVGLVAIHDSRIPVIHFGAIYLTFSFKVEPLMIFIRAHG
jgi:hypothetical protein